MPGGDADPDDERPMICEHRLVPCNPELQAGKRPFRPLQHLRHTDAALRRFRLRQIICSGLQSTRPFTSKEQK